ncbi:MAG: DUF4160 domain-containing protein [Actinomycetota bacterium]
MYFGDHDPPHVHVHYSGYRAKVMLDGTTLEGALPRRAARLVREWTSLHRSELGECWGRVLRREAPRYD